MGNCACVTNRNKDLETYEVELYDFDAGRIRRDSLEDLRNAGRARTSRTPRDSVEVSYDTGSTRPSLTPRDSLEDLHDTGRTRPSLTPRDSLEDLHDTGSTRPPRTPRDSLEIYFSNLNTADGDLPDSIDSYIIDGELLNALNTTNNDIFDEDSDSVSSLTDNGDIVSIISFEEAIDYSTHVFIDGDSCGVCISEYDDGEHLPRILPCGHTFCDLCVRKISKRHKYHCLTCPLDRIVHRIKTQNLDDESSELLNASYYATGNEGDDDPDAANNVVTVEEILTDNEFPDYCNIYPSLLPSPNGRITENRRNSVVLDNVVNASADILPQHVTPLYVVPRTDTTESDITRTEPLQTRMRRHLPVTRELDTTEQLRAIIRDDTDTIWTEHLQPRRRRYLPVTGDLDNVEHLRDIIRGDTDTIRTDNLQPRRRRHLPVTGDLDNIEHLRDIISDDTDSKQHDDTRMYSRESLRDTGYHQVPLGNRKTEWHVYHGSQKRC